jgi:hypothetical protein
MILVGGKLVSAETTPSASLDFTAKGFPARTVLGPPAPPAEVDDDGADVDDDLNADDSSDASKAMTASWTHRRLGWSGPGLTSRHPDLMQHATHPTAAGVIRTIPGSDPNLQPLASSLMAHVTRAPIAEIDQAAASRLSGSNIPAVGGVRGAMNRPDYHSAPLAQSNAANPGQGRPVPVGPYPFGRGLGRA